MNYPSNYINEVESALQVDTNRVGDLFRQLWVQDLTGEQIIKEWSNETSQFIKKQYDVLIALRFGVDKMTRGKTSETIKNLEWFIGRHRNRLSDSTISIIRGTIRRIRNNHH